MLVYKFHSNVAFPNAPLKEMMFVYTEFVLHAPFPVTEFTSTFERT